MKEFKDKVAVVTGAASGIGRGIAARCAREGMKVVLADIETEPLAAAEAEMRSGGATVLAVPTDVAKWGDVEALARETLEAFGAAHLLFNNAGVGGGASLWEASAADWEWVVGVNLWGVVHGIRAFVPIMLQQEAECHVVNTASVAGLTSGPNLGIYRMTKHAVVSLSETLYLELAQRGAKVKVSVLCPAFVNTRISESERNRPPGSPPDEPRTAEHQALTEFIRRAVQQGMPPDRVADFVFDAIREEKFYILTHPEWKEAVRARMEDILLDRNPTNPPS